MSLLPFQSGDVVSWKGELGVVREVRGDRLVVETLDGVLHLATAERLRAMQRVRKGAA